MALPRFFVSSDVFLNGSTEISLTGSEVRHMIRVLRLARGAEVKLLDGRGGLATAYIVSVSGGEVRLAIDEVYGTVNDLLPLALVCAVLKGSRMDMLIQKAVEFGAAVIRPVITERTVVKLDRKARNNRLVRWREIARQALKQCRGVFLPEIYPVSGLGEALNLPDMKVKIVLSESETDRSLLGAWKEQGWGEPIALLVGPEGGFTHEELETVRGAGFIGATMGRKILRAETAAIGAAGVVAAVTVAGKCGDSLP
ncbi:MAG TPA: 16S rRNA (uracil(1498)-N(3))-methyltransferase [Thermodesulfobacteriaceae bacterium]|nr:16S rRNA (uracil(1498)-N(3))-methyltransferase [Thermodesulfobacteriaceae bacterium]